MGSQFWGTGLFVESACAILDFGVDTIGLERFEARAAVANGRGNGALRKIGAVQEACCADRFIATATITSQCCGRSSPRLAAAALGQPAAVVH